MNILIVTSWFPSKLNATNGNFIERHILALISQGHNIVVLHEGFSNKIPYPHLEKEVRDEIEIYHLFQPRWFKPLVVLRRFFGNKALNRINNSGHRFDIVHGQILNPVGPIALMISEKLGVPLVFTEQWSGFMPVNRTSLSKAIIDTTKKVVRQCSYVMPVSRSLESAMKALEFHGNYITINNTVDTKLYYFDPSKRMERFTFLHVSNFAPVKNVEGIIRSFAAFQTKNPTLEVDLLIVGDGDIEKLKSFQRNQAPGLRNIHFLGTQPYYRIAELMQSAHCFVLFSNFETFGCVVAESICTGLPVIGTSVGAVPEIINDQNGYLIEAGNESELARAMHEMVLNQKQFVPLDIEKAAREMYSYQSIANQFEVVYSDAIRNSDSVGQSSDAHTSRKSSI